MMNGIRDIHLDLHVVEHAPRFLETKINKKHWEKSGNGLEKMKEYVSDVFLHKIASQSLPRAISGVGKVPHGLAAGTHLCNFE